MQVLKAINSTLPLYRVVKFRKRRYLTRNNRLRLRYMVSSVAVVSLTSAIFFESTNTSMAFAPSPASHIAKVQTKERTRSDIVIASAHSQKQVQAEILPSAGLQITRDDMEAAELLPLPDDSGEDLAAMHSTPQIMEKTIPASGPREEVLEIGSGETLAGVLQNVGVSDADAYNAVRALAKHYDPRSVKAGQAIEVRLEPGEDGLEFAEMNLRIDPIKEVVVEKTSATQFQSEIKEKEVYLKPKAVKASIETSLYGSAARAGIPASIVAEMIRIYSYQVDFQRDIQEGDKVEIFYETYETEDGEFARYGDILYANLIVGGKNKPVYRFAPKEGVADYFTPDGMNTKKALMRTPIDGARMSSGFGMRRHPVLGYNKMHKGVDFAAPRGTPIYAAGDGVIEVAARNGSYGNYIRIKHNGSLKTAYAHMHKFAKSIAKGKAVKQGQIIGYVGTTGRSTGPHLHFEVLKGKGQVNPNSIDMPVGQVLAGKDLDKFKHHIDSIKQQYVEVSGSMKFAQSAVTQ